ncbi:hypothetical protein [Roseicyclus sp.]|uniref:hypothetical protein n=1 Tax=Roseicyclus sp. TaxID=1914329 RepID=UPI003F69B47E
MKPADIALRPENLASSLKHLIEEIILVFPEGSEGEDAEIQGRICLRLLEQAQHDAERLFAAIMHMSPPPSVKDRLQAAVPPIVICQR